MTLSYSFFGWLTTLAFALCYVPQLVRTFRRKEVGDISIWQWWIQGVGYMSGLAYGIYLNEWPLIFGYTWGFLATAVFLIMYKRYKK